MGRSRIAAVICLAVLLGGCPKGAGITCPTLRQYSPEFMSRVSEQIEMIEAKAPDVVEMLNDYGVERDAIRKCLALQKKPRK